MNNGHEKNVVINPGQCLTRTSHHRLNWWSAFRRVLGIDIEVSVTVQIFATDLKIIDSMPAVGIKYGWEVIVGHTDNFPEELCPHSDNYDDCPDCRH